MFKSFFPKPGPFFISAFIWSLLAADFSVVGGVAMPPGVRAALHGGDRCAARGWVLPNQGC